jgi:hypothetical protein
MGGWSMPMAAHAVDRHAGQDDQATRHVGDMIKLL